ncbi:hypothetical protein FB451DRAFT_1412417 [Mycena latifolia]|nr:hypothetical protein FB451DRAFT_1412417 [Mycena latifolia]
MSAQCIPANPDISGIGVRAAIYAQNLLCFAPVVAHLWDGKVSVDEMRGVKDQSIGMLAIAFAILISSVIQATGNAGSEEGLTRFHAAVILDLSWMNNTSTWIWFLLYAHHLTKPEGENGRNSRKPTPATWSAWKGVLLLPLLRLVAEAGPAHLQENDHAEQDPPSAGPPTHDERPKMKIKRKVHKSERRTIIHRAWYFVSQKPVLTLGSIHLSLMGAIGLWLWSNPSKFGRPISCDPSLTVVGGALPFSSVGLRIFSLAIYSLLVVPGFNLVPPFLFFLVLHIAYNKSRECHPHFWGQLDTLANRARRIPQIFGKGIPRLAKALFRRFHSPSQDLESGTRSSPAPEGTRPPFKSNTPNPAGRTAFLIVGLVSLAFINIVLLVGIELTLRRNNHEQFSGEDEWGFGQVLALLLLVVPVRDFVTSILDVREKVKRDNETKEDIQRDFKEHLQQAILKDTFVDHDFKDLIERGADPNLELDGIYSGYSLHLRNTLINFLQIPIHL